MVGERLQKIPRYVRVKYWHYTTLELYKYLVFTKL